MAVQIQIRRDTQANWESVDPVLAAGEMGVETDTGRFKFGNGTDSWNSIAFSGQAWGNIVGTLSDQTDLQNALDGKIGEVQHGVTLTGKGTAAEPLHLNLSANFDFVGALQLSGNDVLTVADVGTADDQVPTVSQLMSSNWVWTGANQFTNLIVSGSNGNTFLGTASTSGALNVDLPDEDGTILLDTTLYDTDTNAVAGTMFIDEQTGYLCFAYHNGAIEILASDGYELLNGPAGAYDSRISTTRNTKAIRLTEDFNLEEVEPHVARRTYNPDTERMEWLFEEERTNIVKSSVLVDDSNWDAGSATLTELSLNRLGFFPGLEIASGGESFHRAVQNTGQSLGPGTISVDVYYEEGSSGFMRIRITDDVGDLSQVAGEIGADSWFQNDGLGIVSDINDRAFGDIRRITFLIELTESKSGIDVSIGPHSTTAGETVIVHGFQVHEGPLSSFINTPSSGLGTRADDRALMDGQPFEDIWNDEEGSIVIEWEYMDGGNTQNVSHISDGTNPNRIWVDERNGGRVGVEATDVFNTLEPVSGVSKGDPVRLAFAFNDDGFSACFDGGSVLTTSIPEMPIGCDRFLVAADSSGTISSLPVKLTAFHYYPKKLPDYLVQGLSKLLTVEAPKFSIPVIKDKVLHVGAQVQAQQYHQGVIHSHGNVSGAKTIDLGQANYQAMTLTGNSTFSFKAPAGPCSCNVLITNSGAGNTITLPGGVVFETGAQNEDDAAKYVLTIIYDGSDYWVSWAT